MGGEFEVNGKKDRLESLQQKIEKHEKQIHKTTVALTQFNEQAEEKLAELRVIADEKEKARNQAQQRAAAAERNLDSYVASLKAMADDEAFGRTSATGGAAGAIDKTKGPSMKKAPRGLEPKRKASQTG